MISIEVTESAKDELSSVLKVNADKFIRLYVQGAG